MIYGMAADAVVCIHLGWIVFLITGAYWGRKNRAVMAIHAAGLFFAVISQVFGWYCPLTDLEVWLREKQNPLAAYPGSFIAHYAEKLVYLEVPPLIVFSLTLAIAAFTTLIYLKALTKKIA